MKLLATIIAACFAASAMAACGTSTCCYRSYNACWNHHKLLNIAFEGKACAAVGHCSDKILSTCNADCCNMKGQGVSC
ncbi:hypothetical protein EJ02DRAFT_460877 [Clathrospora elynae]|uniref:Extracellular membrane protein CFEM domain-containing protein n=1 Tax=Clathrospora elynae TaxID=706981 RepID=A0A6A5SBN1_9PLEO|nr:hypothetical protein EJ02DRAFT_460877 [Clathrospora elynae]